MQRGMLIAFLATSASLFAQVKELRLTADIPFAFEAGTTMAPAGTYDVAYRQGWLVLQNVKGGKQSYLISDATAREDRPRSATLVFVHYGDRYFLREVWPRDSAQGRELPATKAEIKLARMVRPGIAASILATEYSVDVTFHLAPSNR